jgi:bifunctional glutamyl/prolyl-tRNA synthetase
LKSSKAAKDVIDKSVAELLSLKGEFKKVTGSDWKPEAAAAAPVVKQEVKASEPAATAVTSGSNDAVINVF